MDTDVDSQREKRNMQAREWRKANPGKVKAKYVRLRGKIRAWNKKWAADHRDRINELQRRKYWLGEGSARRLGRETREALLPSRDATEKTCSVCGLLLSIGNFSLNKGARDGRRRDCKACANERNKRCYATHTPEQKLADLAYRKNYYHSNPARSKAMIKVWVNANKDTERFKLNHIAKSAKRRARVRSGGGELSAAALASIIERDCGRCYLCGEVVSRSDRSFDHVIPLAKGGSNDPANVALTHRRCNSRKGDRIVRLC